MAGTEETPRVRPLPWKVKAAVLVCAIKAVIMTIKMPYVIFQTYTSLPAAGIFQAAIAASTLLGSWLMPRVVRSCSQPVIAWFIHLCSLAGNAVALAMPDSLLPILPSSIVSPTSLATLLMAGCSEHFQATDEEALAWGRWASTAFGAVAALAPVVVPFMAEFEQVNFFCFAADALVTLPMLALPMPKEPKEQQAPPSAWSWARTLRMRSLRTAPVLWMLSWSFVQALEHSMLELVILVHMTTTLTPNVIQLSMIGVLGQGLAPATYSIVFGGPVHRLYSIAPRLLLLGLCLFLVFLRGLSFLMTFLSAFYLLAIAGANTVQAVGHIKQLLWAELITQEDEAEGIAGLQGTVAPGSLARVRPVLRRRAMGKKAGKKEGAGEEGSEKTNGSKEEAKGKKKGGKCRKCRSCCSLRCAICMLVFAFGLGIPWVQDTITMAIVLNFLRARYYYEGLPMEAAWKDTLYFATTIQKPSLLFIDKFLEVQDLYTRQLLKVEPGDDHITALCKVSMYTTMVTSSTEPGASPLWPVGMSNFDTHDPVPTKERVNSYLQACVEVYKSLDKDSPQRKILDTLPTEIKDHHSAPKLKPTTQFARDQAKRARYDAAAERPDHSHLWKKTSEYPDYGYMFERSKIRPVKEEVIDASEIPEAVRQGRVARFDATKLLGKEIFNMSMPEIAALHGDMAEQIPMYRQQGASAPGRSGIDNLRDYAHRVRVWKEVNAIRFPEHKPFGRAGFSLPRDASDFVDAYRQPAQWLEILAMLANLWLVPMLKIPLQEVLRQVRSAALQCAVNTRRLPKLPMPKIEDALGNPDWLERAWTMFWLGPVEDCWHYDDPDNLLIGVYGDIWVTVFQLKDRELMRGNADRGCWSGAAPMPKRIDLLETAQTEGWLEKFQFVHFKLTPGTGVTVPSGAFHSLTMADGDRILMNCFMIPKYKGLWDAPAANYSFYSNEWQTEEYHALAQLKKSSIFRLWDTKKLGGYFEGAKLEML